MKRERKVRYRDTVTGRFISVNRAMRLSKKRVVCEAVRRGRS